ncbi:ABC transporter ATP-binding protein [Sphingobium sp. CR2-8]|uniref:ABC transporter ATP-binding protein n=1 Tax=Sphingobium sp. CR2-8 TaxID=1306534 RepID=UPI002DBB9E0F|nr:ABC transporter ATP-binding protein [Sphingobium sp. CR2-8]MEC3912796.1 ABC transporter ATP-binding protein [Sphingobium sp. CR2-8]
MIELHNITKVYPTTHGPISVLKGINLRVERGEKIGILGRNGAGKSTMIRILSGAEQPTSGTLTRGMSLSWPLAFVGGFQSSLTGIDNLRFVCRIYGVDYQDKVDFVKDFTELGRFLDEPIRTYSSGMRARLAFALSMVIEFDCFLIDEVIAVGDQRFYEKCHEELFVKRADRAHIIVSHHPDFVRSYCSKIGLITDGRLFEFNDVEEAYQRYDEVLHQA